LPGMMSFNLPFFGVMSLLYLVLGAVWMVAFIKNWRSVMQLQYCITAVVVRTSSSDDPLTVHSCFLIQIPAQKKAFPVRFVWASSQKGLKTKKWKKKGRLPMLDLQKKNERPRRS